MIVPLATPPWLTVSEPPLSTALMSLPDTWSVPLLSMMAPLTVPPDRMLRVAPERTRTLSLVCPEETVRVPLLTVTEIGLGILVTSVPPLPSEVR
jgi:hypothetical protein